MSVQEHPQYLAVVFCLRRFLWCRTGSSGHAFAPFAVVKVQVFTLEARTGKPEQDTKEAPSQRPKPEQGTKKAPSQGRDGREPFRGVKKPRSLASASCPEEIQCTPEPFMLSQVLAHTGTWLQKLCDMSNTQPLNCSASWCHCYTCLPAHPAHILLLRTKSISLRLPSSCTT